MLRFSNTNPMSIEVCGLSRSVSNDNLLARSASSSKAGFDMIERAPYLSISSLHEYTNAPTAAPRGRCSTPQLLTTTGLSSLSKTSAYTLRHRTPSARNTAGWSVRIEYVQSFLRPSASTICDLTVSVYRVPRLLRASKSSGSKREGSDSSRPCIPFRAQRIMYTPCVIRYGLSERPHGNTSPSEAEDHGSPLFGSLSGSGDCWSWKLVMCSELFVHDLSHRCDY